MKRTGTCFVCALLLLCLLAGCGKTPPARSGVNSPFLQHAALNGGEVTAVLHTALGDITLVLYPSEAPLAVRSFCLLAAAGAYDGTPFHRVVEGFVVQGGDTAGDGSLGASGWGAPFEAEYSNELFHFSGALCTAEDADGLSGSQFYIVASRQDVLDEAALQTLRGAGLSEELVQAYGAAGGLPYLDNTDTVFGQVVDGMDVVDAIATRKTDADGRPKKEVLITSIEVSGYAF